jgi:argininosuccinate lyase
MKLWSKDNTDTSKQVEKFTVGKDKEFDLLLAPFDILGSIAHAKMLGSVGLLTKDEACCTLFRIKKYLPACYEDSQLLRSTIM